MPTIKGVPGPYRLFFFSFDCNEPTHVHVQRENDICKFWIEPLTLATNHGFSARELNRARRTIEDHLDRIKEAWDEHCGNDRAADP
ncbi:MAG TPA: DUF4160 domain-containing protein [Longimicrobiaceae bacterium]|nr:DUF4160 domain-containing protein [Longimicrobiaceae bacterium]